MFILGPNLANALVIFITAR